MDLCENIKSLKKEKNAIILAHNYQPLEIHQIADMVGDSYQLAKAVVELNKANLLPDAKNDVSTILFCGVRFMAETAKLLNPQTKVLLSASDAGCPMADMAEASDLQSWKEHNPSHLIVCYVNSSVEIKALSDVCVTSSNAVHIVKQLPSDKPIMFVPDQNLGHYVRLQTGRQIDLWDGYCLVHHFGFTMDDIHKARHQFPDHLVIVHPECVPEVVANADFVGSTKALADFTAKHDKVIIGTECGLVDMLRHQYTDKSIHPLSAKAICKNMKKTTLAGVLNTLQNEANEINIPADIAQKALKPIQKMIELVNSE